MQASEIRRSSRSGRTSPAPRRAVVLASVASLILGMIVAGSVAVATASSTGTTYYGCLHNGSLSKVSESKPKCPSHHKSISWSSVGPQGIQGVQGLTGPTGSRGPLGDTGAPGPGAQYFTSAGTYTVPASATQVEIVAVGGGGGGAASVMTVPGGAGVGSGGAQGATESVLANVTSGAVLNIVVGQGGAVGTAPLLECQALGNGSQGTPSEVANGPQVLALAGGGQGGTMGCNAPLPSGGAGGVPTPEPGVTTIAAVTGTAGGVPPSFVVGGLGGGTYGVAGSGGSGSGVGGTPLVAPGENGYVEVIPN
jgi:hypothetical protein